MATALANVLFLAGRFDDCVEQCRKALELDTGAVAAHTILRWAYERKGMHMKRWPPMSRSASLQVIRHDARETGPCVGSNREAR